ncbi:hypothetical protein GS502_11050 [Rhodococcus hoagii]|nr:hypothetical protein [Prescottella equi]
MARHAFKRRPRNVPQISVLGLARRLERQDASADHSQLIADLIVGRKRDGYDITTELHMEAEHIAKLNQLRGTNGAQPAPQLADLVDAA